MRVFYFFKYLLGLFLLVTVFLFGACKNQDNQRPFPIESTLRLEATKLGVSTIASNLDVPWEITWGPDNWIWFTEQGGKISKVNPETGEIKELMFIPNVARVRTLGLLGMDVSQDKSKPYLFADYNIQKNDTLTVSRLSRFTYSESFDTLTNEKVLLEVPAANPGGHNGSRVKISPNGKVFWTTGDRTVSELAQDTASLNGKVLRLNMDGSVPDDNPFKDNYIWSLGHRNSQGMTFSEEGLLYSSEHGADTDDELNLIEKGGNYGWPNVAGYVDSENERIFQENIQTKKPILVWTPPIAPSGIAYYGSDRISEWRNSILLATLKGASLDLGVSLHVIKLSDKGNLVLSDSIYFKGEFGRLRDVCVSPRGDIYVATSNKDWNPLEGPRSRDDRILRIAKMDKRDDLTLLDQFNQEEKKEPSEDVTNNKGRAIYTSYCTACHKEDGNGMKDLFPYLNKNETVLGDPNKLITIILKGDVAIDESEKGKWSEGGMPAFNSLKNADIKELVNYIRNSWDNSADSIDLKEIEGIRENLSL